MPALSCSPSSEGQHNDVTIAKVHIKGYRKFDELIFEPNPKINIVVGGNEAGKSTLLEAITLALTGKVNGVPAAEFLSPYLFNKSAVDNFFSQVRVNKEKITFPEFRIDVYLKTDNRKLQKIRGVNNMMREDSLGVSILAHPDSDYLSELKQYFKQENFPDILPVEYYSVEWLGFDGAPILKRFKELSVSLVDSRTIRSERGVDYYTHRLLETHLNPRDRNRISVEYRKRSVNLGCEVLKELNDDIEYENNLGNESKIGIQVDQSKSSSWESSLIPDINGVPLSMAGQGRQVYVKTVLALARSEGSSNLVFVEEPENHLSHTRLRELISCIEHNANGRQIFITTHSSYVLNRLGLDKIVLLNEGKAVKFEQLDKKTVSYFKRLSGFDTMRLVLADRIIIVEGPSDEIVFNRFFRDRNNYEPLDRGIDVMAINGVSFSRCFELAALLKRQLFALRDNDGKGEEFLRRKIAVYLEDKQRSLFVGRDGEGDTLESQICRKNKESDLKKIFPQAKSPIDQWMKKNKTLSAMAIAESDISLNVPEYIAAAIEALCLNDN